MKSAVKNALTGISRLIRFTCKFQHTLKRERILILHELLRDKEWGTFHSFCKSNFTLIPTLEEDIIKSEISKLTYTVNLDAETVL